MPQLPDIAPQQAQRLNAGPRHARGSAFSNHNYNRLYRDNTLTAETRHSGRRDKVAEERELRRKKARQEQEKRTEKRLKTLERRMKDEAKRIAAMERELKELPKLKKTRQQLAHEWAHMDDSPRTSRSAETGRDDHDQSPRSESAPARSSPLPDIDGAAITVQRAARSRRESRAAVKMQAHQRRRRASLEVDERRRESFKRRQSVLSVAATSALACARDASRTCVLYRDGALRACRMVKARRAYDAIYLLQRFARYVGGQAALALAAEVVLFKQRRLCKRVERLHGTRQKRRAEREATNRLAVSIQNASRRRKARQEYQRRCERRNEVLKGMAAFLAHTLQKHARRRSARRRAHILRQRWRGRRKLVSLDLNDVKKAVLKPAKLEEAYGAAWAALGIDGALLADPELDEEDLQELGVAVRLHRRRLLKDVARLRTQGVPEDVLEPTPREEPEKLAEPLPQKRTVPRSVAAAPADPLPQRTRAVPRSVAAARAAEEAASTEVVPAAAPRRTAAAFVPKQAKQPAPKAPAKAAPRVAGVGADGRRAAKAKPAKAAAPTKAATKRPQQASKAAAPAKAPAKRAAAARQPKRAEPKPQRRPTQVQEPKASPARRPLADAANSADKRANGRDAEVAAARRRAAERKKRGAQPQAQMSKTANIPAERKRIESKASVFANADDSSDSEDVLEGVKASTYPRASFASPSVFEERGDESPDLSATFFSNEDSSDSGDVPIRMSGSLPDIPAETLFKGSVLEDDGFFDEDDFEDVGNGEDVADLFA